MDDVVADGVEGRMAQDVAKQGGSCGIADIDTEDLVAVGEQPQAEMCPDEPGAAEYDDSFLHDFSVLPAKRANSVPHVCPASRRDRIGMRTGPKANAFGARFLSALSAFYSMKSALGSWSMPVIPTTSIPFGRRVPLAR